MTLSLQAKRQVWCEGAWEDLVADMQHLQDATMFSDIHDMRDLQMRPDGMITGPQGPYRMSTGALRQVCKILSPGLFQTICAISGQRFLADDDPAAYSVETAAAIYNQALGLRFGCRFGLGYQAIWNLHDELLDGVLGTRYVTLPNPDMLELAETTRQTLSPLPVFQEAWRHGRRLTCRFVCEAPLFTVHTATHVDDWHAGVHFENSETGESSVRIFPVLWHAASGAYVVDMRRTWHVPHTGADFRKRIRKTIQTATERYSRLFALQQPLQKLAVYPFPVRRDELQGHPAVGKLLSQLGLSKSWLNKLLRQTITSTVLFGRLPQAEVDVLALTSEEAELPARTGYDFLLQMLYTSLRQESQARVELEHVGKQIITRLNDDENGD